MAEGPEAPIQGQSAKQSDDKPENVVQNATLPKEKKALDLWAYIGKASVLVGLIIGAISIYSYINPRGPRVIATCTVVEISDYLRYGGQIVLNEMKQNVSTDTVAMAMPQEAGKAAHEQPVLKSFAKNLLMILGPGPFDPLRSLDRTDRAQALRCAILNDGTEPATELQLHLPDQAIRVFINKKDVLEKDSRSQDISLGTLPAGPTLIVEAWIDVISSVRSFEKNIFLNFRGGTGRVQLGQTYFGTANSLAHFWDLFGPFGLAWIALMIILVILLLASRIDQAQTKAKSVSTVAKE